MLYLNKENSFEVSSNEPFKIAVIGTWQGHKNGSFKIGEAELKSMLEYFLQRKVDLVIDYEHQSLLNEKAPAAGWIYELFIKDNALWAKAKFNEEATSFIKNKQYRYVSPVFEFNAKDNKDASFIKARLHSVALTNTPFMDELGELIANKNTKIQGEKMQDLKELEAQIFSLKQENEKLQKAVDENAKFSKEQSKKLALTQVEKALAKKLIDEKQKEWALAYACKDLAGFEDFLQTCEPKQIPQSNLYANKDKPKQEEFDVVKLMLS